MRDVLTAPLLQRIVDAVAAALHRELLAQLELPAEGELGVALYALRLSPHVEPRIIADPQPPALHLWRDGGFLNAVSSLRTECNRMLVARDCWHVERGDWLMAAESGAPLCAGCESRAAAFPETMDAPEPGLTRELGPLPAAHLSKTREDVEALATKGTLVRSAFIDARRDEYVKAVSAAAVTLLLADEEAACMRVLHDYIDLRKASPSDLYPLLAGEWDGAVEQAVELARAGHARAVVRVLIDDRLTDALP